MGTKTGQPAAPDPEGGTSSGGAGGREPEVVQIPERLWVKAAMRLLPESAADGTVAAQRFIESAHLLKIDLGLMYGTIAPDGSSVREVCLGVLGSGRTGMVFVSSPSRRGRAWGGSRLRSIIAPGAKDGEIGDGPDAPAGDGGARERIACIRHVCRVLSEAGPIVRSPARLAQALLDAREKDVASALRSAGFIDVGELAYMRRGLPRQAPTRDFDLGEDDGWPPGVRVVSVDELIREGHEPATVDEMIIRALDRSYVQTLDCPELCGLRDTSDVLDSHRAVGQYDPSLWWLVLLDGEPEGCLLLNVSQEQDSVELVYIGLSPKLRGKGVAGRLLSRGILALYKHSIGESQRGPYPVVRGSGGITCAVDMRNQPALHLYKRLGFTKFGQRWPMVARLAPGQGIAASE